LVWGRRGGGRGVCVVESEVAGLKVTEKGVVVFAPGEGVSRGDKHTCYMMTAKQATHYWLLSSK